MSATVDFRLIFEGQCPHGHGPLERRDEDGYCATCKTGWARRGGTLIMNMECDSSMLDGTPFDTSEGGE